MADNSSIPEGVTGEGVIVDHKESGIRYAVSTANFNGDIHSYVRGLHPSETVLGYAPRPRPSKPAENSPAGDSATPAERNQPTQTAPTPRKP